MSKRRRNYRKPQALRSFDPSDDEDSLNEKIADVRFWQKVRLRQSGFSVEMLTALERDSKQQQPPSSLKEIVRCLNSGEAVDVRTMKSRDLECLMKGNFAKEKDNHEEDERMLKYIEEELEKRRKDGQLEGSSSKVQKIDTLDEALHSVSRRLTNSIGIPIVQNRSEEMLSEQMLSGIPEVDLGFEEKVRNIKETERMRQLVLEKLREKKDEPQEDCIDFVQHCRFNTTDTSCELPSRLDSPSMDDSRGEIY
ncbi:hypothetical protein ACOME3_000278 [Neoechinorhynchus agilis]